MCLQLCCLTCIRRLADSSQGVSADVVEEAIFKHRITHDGQAGMHDACTCVSLGARASARHCLRAQLSSIRAVVFITPLLDLANQHGDRARQTHRCLFVSVFGL